MRAKIISHCTCIFAGLVQPIDESKENYYQKYFSISDFISLFRFAKEIEEFQLKIIQFVGLGV